MFLRDLNYLDANIVIDTTFRGMKECDVWRGKNIKDLVWDDAHRYIIVFANGDMYVRYPIGWRFNAWEVFPYDEDTTGDVAFVLRNNACCWFVDADTLKDGWVHIKRPVFRYSCNLNTVDFLD